MGRDGRYSMIDLRLPTGPFTTPSPPFLVRSLAIMAQNAACAKSRALTRGAGSRSRGILHGPMRLSPVFTRGGRLHRRAATRGYTPDDFARSREVGEGLHELSAAAIPEGNVQGTAAERRSQSQPLSDSLPRPIRGLNCAGSVQLSTPLCTVNSHSDRLHGAALRHVAPRCHLETASG